MNDIRNQRYLKHLKNHDIREWRRHQMSSNSRRGFKTSIKPTGICSIWCDWREFVITSQLEEVKEDYYERY